eukprot:4766216-Alexandrium_andersonii.AAC.1
MDSCFAKMGCPLPEGKASVETIESISEKLSDKVNNLGQDPPFEVPNNRDGKLYTALTAETHANDGGIASRSALGQRFQSLLDESEK